MCSQSCDCPNVVKLIFFSPKIQFCATHSTDKRTSQHIIALGVDENIWGSDLKAWPLASGRPMRVRPNWAKGFSTDPDRRPSQLCCMRGGWRDLCCDGSLEGRFVLPALAGAAQLRASVKRCWLPAAC